MVQSSPLLAEAAEGLPAGLPAGLPLHREMVARSAAGSMPSAAVLSCEAPSNMSVYNDQHRGG
jgi:hypothetical protein